MVTTEDYAPTTGGTVQLVFDISDAGGSGAFDPDLIYYLLKREHQSNAGPVFNNSSFEVVPVLSTTLNGDTITFEVDSAHFGEEVQRFTLGITNIRQIFIPVIIK